MKRLVAMVLVLGICGVAAVAAPMISVDNPIYAVTVQSGSIVTHSFAITNAGDETLTITSVSTSCGCTAAAMSKQILAPGESVSLDASVDTKGFHGAVTRTVSVGSNDPVNPTLELQFVITMAGPTAPVVPEISVGDLNLIFYLLIDARTPEEYASGHLFGAMNIPLAEFQTNLAVWLPRLPREVPIIVYCKVGGRSMQAATILVEAGLTNVFNLTGGITEWDKQFGVGALYSF